MFIFTLLSAEFYLMYFVLESFVYIILFQSFILIKVNFRTTLYVLESGKTQSFNFFDLL